MRPFIKIISLFTLLYLITGCTKDFLNENLESGSFTLGLSNIYVSPDWQSSNYLFKLPSVNEVDYEIVSKPSWLEIGSNNGHLSDSIAIVQCSATRHPDFEAVGIYTEFMTVKADGQNYKVPVAYITEGNPTAQVQTTLTLSYSNYSTLALSIRNSGEGILLWGITSMPDWLVIDTAQVESNAFYISPNASYSLPLRYNLDEVYTASLTGAIVLSTNDKEHPSITINVTADLGTPQLTIYTSTINFSFTETSEIINFYNYGNGILVWEFKDIPEWLTITPSSGMFFPYTYGSNVIFSCDRTKLLPGQNSAIVNLKTNDSFYPSYSIKVIANAPGISENIHAVDGNIIDAVFNKNTNTLYYVTSSPNKFIAYDVMKRNVQDEILLSKSPTSLAISEDWTRAAVGHNGFISAINLSGNTVTTVYTLNYSVNDIAWAENDWFCYTQNGESVFGLHWINTADGTLYDDPNQYDLDGKSIVKKVPNQPYLIATRNATSPSGFLAYDIATKSKKSYAHMDLYNFWFSQNGDYIFSRNLNVYRTTSSTGSTNTFDADISAIGKIGIEGYYGLRDLYHSNDYLWLIKEVAFPTDESTSLYQVEDNDYTLVKSYDYDLIYQPDAQTTPIDVTANFVFVNKEETEILVLCKGLSSNFWIMQFLSVE
ncbi:BACON domain-containing protein [Geofilum sp. OHC36d9]|uniref:BACON domain-containing protein n=1 Tax=Geofilum sp. OHC36d9 TaxID=3458413 RepID=UPI00403456F2